MRRIVPLALLVFCAGCGPRGSASWFGGKPSKQLVERALKDRRPDERRKAVSELARGRDATSDWAIRTFDAIARTDSDPMVRVEAVRGLARSGSARTVPTLVKLLNSADAPIPDVRPAAPPQVRWEAAALLERIAARSALPPPAFELALAALMARVDHDPDRNVRFGAIDALRYFRDRRVLPLLVGAMRTRDFAQQHHCEMALRAMTGQTHHHDADAWDRWLAQTRDPFARPRRDRPAAPPFAGS